MPLSRFLAAGSVAALALAGPAVAHAATITVTTTADAVGTDGVCSLREAVTAANADAALPGLGECAAGTPGATDRIVLAAGLYRRSVAGVPEDANAAGDLDVTGPLEILGAGSAVTIIDAAGTDRVIDVRSGGSLRLADVSLTGGAAPGGASAPPANTPGAGGAMTGGAGGAGEDGGGVRAAGPLAIERGRVSGNAGGDGGDGGDATGVTPSALETPGGDGTAGGGGRGGAGAIWSSGGLTLVGTVVSGNRGGAGGDGGAGRGGTGVGGPGGPAGGGAGAAGDGGDGGAGAIAAVGVVAIRDSAVLGNRSGDGGAGGDGIGGPAAAGGGEGENGGDGTGGAGGSGGPGGGVDVAGPVTIERSTVASNTTGRGGGGGQGLGGFPATPGAPGTGRGGAGGAGGAGGGLVARTTSLSLVNATLAGNISGAGGGGGGGVNRGGLGGLGGAGGPGGPGGGLAVTGGTAGGSFVTISGNGSGGAGEKGMSGDSGNPGAGGSAGAPGLGDGAGVASGVPVSLAASVIAGNGCAGASQVVDGGGNVNQAAPGCPGTAGDARLGSLAANGGVPPTLQPGPGSAVIDRVPGFLPCPATDARGATRPVGATCDVGAYEVAPPVATTGAATVTGATARITGTVATRGVAAGVRVQIGRTASYGTETPLVTVPGDAGPTGVGVTVGGLAPLATYHYRLVATGPDGTSVGADRTFTVTPPSLAGLRRPRITGLKVRPKAFAPVPRGGSRTGARKGRPAQGTLVAFRLSERATVAITVTRNLRGRVVGAGKRTRCAPVSATAKVRRGRGCIRVRTLGTVRRAGRAGVNRFVMTGNVGTRPLAPGRYRLVFVATDRDGRRSAPARVTIRILPASQPPPRRSATGG